MVPSVPAAGSRPHRHPECWACAAAGVVIRDAGSRVVRGADPPHPVGGGTSAPGMMRWCSLRRSVPTCSVGSARFGRACVGIRTSPTSRCPWVSRPSPSSLPGPQHAQYTDGVPRGSAHAGQRGSHPCTDPAAGRATPVPRARPYRDRGGHRPYSALGYAESGGNYGVLVALYTVAANSTRRTAPLAAVLTSLGILLTFANYVQRDPHAAGSCCSCTPEYAVAWVVGTYLQGSPPGRAGASGAGGPPGARTRGTRSLAVAEERARIARELHDVVAHHVSVMVVQAGAARRVVATDPSSAREARWPPSSRPGAPRSPRCAGCSRSCARKVRTRARALAGRPRASSRGSGLRACRSTWRSTGERPEVPAGADLAAYRIVQEALTNVVKHAGKAIARVRISYAPDRVEVEVTDDGRGAAAHLDVELGRSWARRDARTGPPLRRHAWRQARAGGGYRVHAAFPIEPPPPALERPETAHHREGRASPVRRPHVARGAARRPVPTHGRGLPGSHHAGADPRLARRRQRGTALPARRPRSGDSA